MTGNYFVSTYPPFSCWTAQGAADFRTQLLASDRPPAGLGVYVHVPFCADRCHYCYYLSHDRRFGDVDAYLEALSHEIGRYAASPALAGRPADFVYVGGGTPSVLGASKLAALLAAIDRAFPYGGAREVCVECAPRSATTDRLTALRDAGVTRISLGVQQLDDEVLTKNGRIHLVRDVERAFAAIRDTGFAVVNLDLIAGLVGETDDTFFRSLERIIEWQPESVTVYQLEIPQNTPLFRTLHTIPSADAPAGWPAKQARAGEAFRRLEQAGYTVRSAYAAVRDPARHAFIYQDAQYHGADVLGLGASAFSHIAGVNQQNLATLDHYLEAARAGVWPHWRGYALEPRERMVRELILQLKLGGVDRRAFCARHGYDPAQVFEKPLRTAERAGRLSINADTIAVTRTGLLSVDRWLTDFYEPAHHGVRYS